MLGELVGGAEAQAALEFRVPARPPLSQHLVSKGILTAPQAREALREAAEKGLDLGEVLILQGFVTPELWTEVYWLLSGSRVVLT